MRIRVDACVHTSVLMRCSLTPLQVLSWGTDVVRWLYISAQHSAKEQRTLIVEAFAAWVRLGLLYEQDLPSMEVQGLLSLTFQCLLDSSESKLSPSFIPPRSYHLLCVPFVHHKAQ